ACGAARAPAPRPSWSDSAWRCRSTCGGARSRCFPSPPSAARGSSAARRSARPRTDAPAPWLSPPAWARALPPVSSPRLSAPRRPAARRAPAGWCTARGGGGRAGSLLGGAPLQPVLEIAVEVGIDRQVVGQEHRVDFLDLGGALVLLPLVDRGAAGDQQDERHQDAQREAAPADVTYHVAGPGQDRRRLGALARQRLHARLAQAIGDLRRDRGAVIQKLA